MSALSAIELSVPLEFRPPPLNVIIVCPDQITRENSWPASPSTRVNSIKQLSRSLLWLSLYLKAPVRPRIGIAQVGPVDPNRLVFVIERPVYR